MGALFQRGRQPTGIWFLHKCAGGVNLSASITWNSNEWHQVALTYSPSGSLLYLDGTLAASGTGSIYYPNAAERAAGLRIGSDQNGGSQVWGTFDELETFTPP